MRRGAPRSVGRVVLLVLCAALIGLLIVHEFVIEPHAYGEGAEPAWVPYFEIAIYSCVPVILLVAWIQMRRRLKPLLDIAAEIDAWDPERGLRTGPPIPASPEASAVAAALARASERLQSSFRGIREFSLRAAHEMKTPLTILRGHTEAEIRRAEERGDSGLATRLEAPIAEIDRLARMVDSLSLLSKADAGLLPMRPAPGRLDELAGEFLDDLRVMAEADSLVVVARTDQPVSAAFDRQRLRQVVLALVDNAIKYNRHGGEILLGTGFEGKEAVLWIENESTTLLRTEASRVFEPFFRGSRCVQTEGSGLGLSIARALVEAQSGRLQFAILSPERVRVSIFLPRAPDVAGSVSPRAASDHFGAGI